MSAYRELYITSDTLLPELQLTSLRRFVTSTRQQQYIFDLLAIYVAEGNVDSVTMQGSAAAAADELPARVPGTSLHLRLSRPTIEEIRTFVTVAGILTYQSGKIDVPGLTVATVVSIRDRLRRTRVEFGERCAVEVVLERSTSTAEQVELNLFGRPCRYPRSNCRYKSNARDCTVGRPSIEAILGSLLARNIIGTESAVDPIEYRVLM